MSAMGQLRTSQQDLGLACFVRKAELVVRSLKMMSSTTQLRQIAQDLSPAKVVRDSYPSVGAIEIYREHSNPFLLRGACTEPANEARDAIRLRLNVILNANPA
jgi:hypothetical protein